MPSGLALLLRVALLACGAALVALVAAARRAEVLAEGQLLTFFATYDEVARVRLLGAELYVDRSSDAEDLLTVTALVLITVVLLTGARAARDDLARRRVLRTAAAGAAFLAADDLLAIHETIGHNLGALAALPVVDHPDDLIMGLYGLVVLGFGLRHRALLPPQALRPVLIAVAAGGLAVAHDLLPLHARVIEEGLEVVCAGALVAAVWTISRAQAPARTPSRSAASSLRLRSTPYV